MLRDLETPSFPFSRSYADPWVVNTLSYLRFYLRNPLGLAWSGKPRVPGLRGSGPRRDLTVDSNAFKVCYTFYGAAAGARRPGNGQARRQEGPRWRRQATRGNAAKSIAKPSKLASQRGLRKRPENPKSSREEP